MQFDIWVSKIPWRRKWQPTVVFLPGESHGQRSLAGYSSWGCKESDTTEGLSIISRDMLAFTTEQVFKFWVVSPSEYHRGSGRVTQIGVGMNGGMNGCKKS